MDKTCNVLIYLNSKISSQEILCSFNPLNIFLTYDVASNYSDFLRLSKSKNYTLAIVSYTLPDTNVHTLLNHTNNLEKDLPLIVIGINTSVSKIVSIVKSGVADFILYSELHRLSYSIKSVLNSSLLKNNSKVFEYNRLHLFDVLDAALEEIYIFDVDSFKLKYVNSSVLLNSGNTLNYFEDISFTEIISENLISYLSSSLDSLLNYSESVIYLYDTFKRHDGSTYPVEIRIQLIEQYTNKVFLAYVYDITDRLEQESQINLLKSAFDQSTSGMIVLDTNFIIQYNNTIINSLFNTDFKYNELFPLINKDFGNFNFEYILNNVLAGNSWTGETTSILDNGIVLDILIIASPIRNLTDTVSNIILIFDNITEKKSVENQLIHAQKMEAMGELVGSVAHDFSNLLTGISGFTSIVKRNIEDQKLIFYMDKVSDLSSRAKRLTQSLLSFCRKRSSIRKSFNLNELISNITDFLYLVSGDDINFNVKLSDYPLYSLVDDLQFEQVVINLVSNAKDAVQPGGNVTLKLEYFLNNDTDEEYAKIIVEDNGSGIDEKIIDKICDPFFTTKGEGKGTGLGMPIVNNIVSQHGGFIEIDSKVGLGTTFSIYFPMISNDNEVLISIEEENDSSAVKNILLVDDDTDVSSTIFKYLNANNYNVFVYDSPLKALEHLKNNKDIDLLITDVVMPHMNGFALYSKILSNYKRIEVIFMTGYPISNLDLMDLDININNILLKPINLNELQEKLDKY